MPRGDVAGVLKKLLHTESLEYLDWLEPVDLLGLEDMTEALNGDVFGLMVEPADATVQALQVVQVLSRTERWIAPTCCGRVVNLLPGGPAATVGSVRCGPRTGGVAAAAAAAAGPSCSSADSSRGSKPRGEAEDPEA